MVIDFALSFLELSWRGEKKSPTKGKKGKAVFIENRGDKGWICLHQTSAQPTNENRFFSGKLLVDVFLGGSFSESSVSSFFLSISPNTQLCMEQHGK